MTFPKSLPLKNIRKFHIKVNQVAESQKSHSFGPAWLSLIPTVWNWFIPYKRSENDVEVDVNLENIKQAMVWDPHKSYAIISDNVPILPFRITDQARTEFKPGESLKLEKSGAARSICL